MEQGRRIIIVAVCLALIQAWLSFAAWAQQRDDEGVVVQEVQVRIVNETPVVLLIVGDRFVPIHVDPTVAASIHSAVTGSTTPRPLSHDLMRLMLLELNAKVERALITLKGQTFYADLTVSLGNRTWVFDSRSSDAIALAVLFKARIMVARPTWESAGQPWSEPKRETS
jgi:hypothetical protein